MRFVWILAPPLPSWVPLGGRQSPLCSQSCCVHSGRRCAQHPACPCCALALLTPSRGQHPGEGALPRWLLGRGPSSLPTLVAAYGRVLSQLLFKQVAAVASAPGTDRRMPWGPLHQPSGTGGALPAPENSPPPPLPCHLLWSLPLRPRTGDDGATYQLPQGALIQPSQGLVRHLAGP